MRSLVLASGNPGKHAEIQALLAPFGTRVVTQVELGITEADEPHETFLENALAKARHACIATRLPALADDSGLCVDALGGAPGVHSARYAGEPRSDARNNEKLLAEMSAHSNRSAYYECALVLMRGPADARPLIARAQWRGTIVREPRGGGGFGYDPLFVPEGRDRTAAELDPEEKNRISHRGQALAKLLEMLRQEP